MLWFDTINVSETSRALLTSTSPPDVNATVFWFDKMDVNETSDALLTFVLFLGGRLYI